mgnify:CR=1 FL=1
MTKVTKPTTAVGEVFINIYNNTNGRQDSGQLEENVKVKVNLDNDYYPPVRDIDRNDLAEQVISYIKKVGLIDGDEIKISQLKKAEIINSDHETDHELKWSLGH